MGRGRASKTVEKRGGGGEEEAETEEERSSDDAEEGEEAEEEEEESGSDDSDDSDGSGAEEDVSLPGTPENAAAAAVARKKRDHVHTMDGRKVTVDAAEESTVFSDVADVLDSWWALFFSLGAFVAYCVLGTLVFAFAEDWSGTEALYYTIMSFTTIGYGDYSPTRPGTRVFCCFFLVLGISIMSFTIGIVATQVVRMNQRFAEKLRKKKQERRARRGQPVVVPTLHTPMLATWWRAFGRVSPSMKHVLVANSASATLVLLGILVMRFAEGWSVVDTAYFVMVTVTTTGYGDFSPTMPSTQLFIVFYSLFATLATAAAMTSFASVLVDWSERRKQKRILEKEFDVRDMIMMDDDADGKVDVHEFVEHMLIRLGKATKEDIETAKQQFQHLDVDGSGYLDENDLAGTALIEFLPAAKPPDHEHHHHEHDHEHHHAHAETADVAAAETPTQSKPKSKKKKKKKKAEE